MDNLVGKVLGNRYELVEKIGGGGMAIVYKARCKLLNRFVAVKILRTDSDMTEDFIKRFKVEAQSAGSLSHPNIVSIYDVGNENDINYIVMEYVEGYTLKEVISQSGKLTWRATIKIASQICSGLEHAHKNHIIHRDIKSQNILVNEELVSKVTDFGIARASSNSTITMTGNTIGSVHYFSPEQAKGQHTDEKSDIYSLGIVMYEMITGHVPFDAETPVSVALKQIQEVPIAPIQFDKDMPIAVNDIIMKALQKEPRLRYQSATEMLKDLQNVFENPDNTVIVDKNIGATTVMPSVTENMINERAAKPTKMERESVSKRRKKKDISTTKSLFAFFIALILVAIISGLAFSKVWKSIIGDEKAEISMPNLVGMTSKEAEEILKENNLKYSIKEQANEVYSKGKVYKQNPQADINVKEGYEVVLFVSSGKLEVAFNDLTNFSLEKAKEELDKDDLKYVVVEEPSESVPVGYVIRTNPMAGRAISPDTIIDIIVSSGPDEKTYEMPKLIGKTLVEAERLAEKCELKLSKKYEEVSNSKAGIVLKQSIDEGSSIKAQETVEIVISKVKTIEKNKKSIYLNLSNMGFGDNTFLVEVKVSGGGYTGKQTVYKEIHTSSDIGTNVDIYGNGEAMVEVFVDGNLNSSQMVKL